MGTAAANDEVILVDYASLAIHLCLLNYVSTMALTYDSDVVKDRLVRKCKVVSRCVRR